MISGDFFALLQQRDRCNMYCHILARHILFLGGISFIIIHEIEMSLVLPLDESNILRVENIADNILDTNNNTPRSKLPDLILGL